MISPCSLFVSDFALPIDPVSQISNIWHKASAPRFFKLKVVLCDLIFLRKLTKRLEKLVLLNKCK